jgi:single-strand DNA-binding protein
MHQGEVTMSLNTIHLVGRAGRDPEVKYFESGSVVCNFTLAVNRATSKKDEPPDWFDLELWGKTAEVAANYVKKGSLIGIQGSLKFDHWNDRNSGAARSKPVIRVERLNLLGSKRDNAESMNNYPDEF